MNPDLATQYARRFAEGNMTAKVKITRQDVPLFNVTSGELAAVEQSVVYQGKARVYTVAGPVTMSLGEEPQYFSQTNISVPLTATPRVDDMVEVTEHDDPAVVGRRFRVLDVESAGQYPSFRRLQVSGVQRSQQWESHPALRSGEDIPEEWRV